MTTKNGEPILIEGILKKKSPKTFLGRPIWQDRYFVLTNSQLCYYKRKEDINDEEKCLGYLLIENINGAVDLPTVAGGLRFNIVLEGVDRLFELEAPSRPQVNNWVDAIKQALRNYGKKPVSLAPPPSTPSSSSKGDSSKFWKPQVHKKILTQRRQAITVEYLSDSALDDEEMKNRSFHKTGHQRALILQALRDCNAFNIMDDQALSDVCNVMWESTFESGQKVFTEGQTSQLFHILVNGYLTATSVKSGLASPSFGPAPTGLANSTSSGQFTSFTLGSDSGTGALLNSPSRNSFAAGRDTFSGRDSNRDSDSNGFPTSPSYTFSVKTAGLGQFKQSNNNNNNSDTSKVHPGQFFGETSLLYDQPLTHTITASGPAVCFTLDRVRYKKLLAAATDRIYTQRQNFLRAIPLFTNANNNLINQVSEALEVRYIKAGQEIICEGQQGDEFYILEQGRCTATVKSNLVCMYQRPGDFFGELALLKNAPRLCTITADVDSKVLYLSQLDFNLFKPHLEPHLMSRIGLYKPLPGKSVSIAVSFGITATPSTPSTPQFSSSHSTLSFSESDDDDIPPPPPPPMDSGEVIMAPPLPPALDPIDGPMAPICEELPPPPPPPPPEDFQPDATFVDHADEDEDEDEDDEGNHITIVGGDDDDDDDAYNADADFRIMTMQPAVGATGNGLRGSTAMAGFPQGSTIPQEEAPSGLPTLGGISYDQRFSQVATSNQHHQSQQQQQQQQQQPQVIKSAAAPTPLQINTNTSPSSGPHPDSANYNPGSLDERLQLQQQLFGAKADLPMHMQRLSVLPQDPTALANKQRLYDYGNGPNHVCTVTNLKDLKIIGTLGRGTFGHVQLVTDSHEHIYALKAVNKAHVVRHNQVPHILNERATMLELDHPFIVKLYRTLRDRDFLYFLLEPSLGGELFTVLRNADHFDNDTARFYAAIVVTVFQYIHNKDILYRDLKPENLLMDADGYIRVTDFGFAKKTKERTYTFCGTPDYLAPEIVASLGHHTGADWWCLGILIYEMLAGFTPFYDENGTGQMYNKILSGKVYYPKSFTPEARDIIANLLQIKPTRRLGVLLGGADVIRRHAWFEGLDWEKLLARELPSPIEVKIKSKFDLTNFDAYEDEGNDDPYTPDPNNLWDEAF